MDIIRTSLLSAGQADEIKELLNGCRDSKGQTPFFPFEDGDLFYLLFTETDDNAASRILACAAALSFLKSPARPMQSALPSPGLFFGKKDISPYFLTNYPRILRRWISTFL